MLYFLFLGCALFPCFFFGCSVWLRRSFPRWSETDVIVISKRHWLVPAYLFLAIPYMVYDICVMYYYHCCKECQEQGTPKLKRHTFSMIWSFFKSERLMVLHHLIVAIIFFPTALFLRRGLGDFLVGCLLMMEMSTPFLSLGKILIQFHLQNTLLYKANGILLLLTFFFCRIAVFPYMYWAYGSQHSIPIYRVPFNIPVFCNLGNILLLLPQLHWFYLLCRKAKCLFYKSRSEKSPSATV
ncbi:TLC domain-containing protein 3A isoform X2 [Protopterus annectens]|uniref:TLC domain-containing protein 3A isoform X2 n=1 Tax=Protopterus annectens TaxID=7888 RepID=UPI001CFBA7BB|nr:TLC domain-containing protein 3A isoform X2 [Protopterus annectens]